MFGEDYIWQYIKQEFEKEQQETIYRVYLTDALQIISENTAHLGGGKAMGKRYWDIIDNGADEPQRTSDEVIATITKQIAEMAGKEEKQSECI